MITKQEIMDFSREFSLPANTIEKDYVLGWLLAGIANQGEIFNNWVFKGGTCLKKCYFETYRFSEDLDYTVTDENQLDEKFLLDRFKKIAVWVYKASGIELPVNSIRFEVYRNSAGRMAVEGRVGYIGPLSRRNEPARIKLDLTADEILVLKPVLREVHHPYTDKPRDGIKAYCYNFSEIFAEKIRALSERARPRDLYDVIQLYRHASIETKPSAILEVLKKKCEYKAISTPSMLHLQRHPKLNELKTEWSNMLAHQLPALPPREQFWKELTHLFDWLHGVERKTQKLEIPLLPENVDTTWHPPSMTCLWHLTVPFELVRYAGANHLCIELTYHNEKQIVEPYNLQRTQGGTLLLIAMKQDSGEWHSYQVDHIQKIEVLQLSFNPRYLILLTPLLNER